MVEVCRSSFYYRLKSKEVTVASCTKVGRPVPGFTKNRDHELIRDDKLVEILRSYRCQVFYQNAYGVTKLTHVLRRDRNIYVNKKKIHRLCKEHELLLPKQVKRFRVQRPLSLNRVITRGNQLWEFDIKYGYIQGESRFFFILGFVDIYSRKCVGSYVGLKCKAGDLTFTLSEAMRREGVRDEDG